MPLPPSMNLTNWLQDSLGGQLVLNYGQPCDLDLWNDLFRLTTPVRAEFHATVNSPGEEVSLWLQANDEGTIKRVIACWLIATMPPNGLDEAFHSLKDIHEFHSYVPPKLLPEKPQTRLTARLGETQQRPPLIIGE